MIHLLHFMAGVYNILMIMLYLLLERNSIPGIKQNSLRIVDATIIQRACNDFLVQAEQVHTIKGKN